MKGKKVQREHGQGEEKRQQGEREEKQRDMNRLTGRVTGQAKKKRVIGSDCEERGSEGQASKGKGL